MWLHSVLTAISEIESRYPGLALEVSNYEVGSLSDPERNDNFYKVAVAIVEPFSFNGGDPSSEGARLYSQMTEEHGFAQVKASLPGSDDEGVWRRICDLVEQNGY